jgi:hypothetical protein
MTYKSRTQCRCFSNPSVSTVSVTSRGPLTSAYRLSFLRILLSNLSWSRYRLRVIATREYSTHRASDPQWFMQPLMLTGILAQHSFQPSLATFPTIPRATTFSVTALCFLCVGSPAASRLRRQRLRRHPTIHGTEIAADLHSPMPELLSALLDLAVAPYLA